MGNHERKKLFNDWAESYDDSTHYQEGFPFDGYNDVLQEIVRASAPHPNMSILDLGIGTGNLAKRFVDHGCKVWGIDLSEKMLSRAHKKVPQARFVQADLLSELPKQLPNNFSRAVSAYVFHEFNLMEKVLLVKRIFQQCLDLQGYLIVGDIAFANQKHMQQARDRWRDVWDDEHYWIADQVLEAFEAKGFRINFTQISNCAGVFEIKKG